MKAFVARQAAYLRALLAATAAESREERQRVLRRPERWLKLLILLSLVVPPSFFCLIAYQSRVAELAAADQRMISTVVLLREHAERVLDADRLAIQQVDVLIAGMTWQQIVVSQSLAAKLQKVAEALPEAEGIALIDPYGNVVAASPAVMEASGNVTDRDYFQAVRIGYQGVLVSRSYPARGAQMQHFDVVHRRSTEDGSFDGIIDISNRAGYFADFYAAVGGQLDAVALMSGDGTDIAHGPRTMFADLKAPSDLLARVSETQPLIVDGVTGAADGTGWRGAYERLHGYPLLVGYAVPDAAITAAWRRMIIAYGILVGFGSLGVALIGWLALRGIRRESIAYEAFILEVERRERAEAAAQQAKRMEAIGRLTAGMAHDFNNLLAVISGNLELLRARAGRDWTVTVESGLSAASRGADLVRQMLTFARRQILRPERINIDARLREFAPLIRSALTQDILVEYRLTAQNVTCQIDRAEFELAVLNAAANSGHAMPQGGQFRIETEVVESTNAPPGAGGIAAGRYVRISLTDTGAGMTAEVLEHAFDPFFSTRDVGKGSGLGLSQVYDFARQSKGAAVLSSVAGQGTTVTIYLPAIQEPVGRAVAQDATARLS